MTFILTHHRNTHPTTGWPHLAPLLRRLHPEALRGRAPSRLRQMTQMLGDIYNSAFGIA